MVIFMKNRISRVMFTLRLVMSTVSMWVHELDIFIYLILAILQGNKLLDNRFQKHNPIQQYVYITC